VDVFPPFPPHVGHVGGVGSGLASQKCILGHVERGALGWDDDDRGTWEKEL